MPISIHGKKYITVAERVSAAHEINTEGFSVETEVLTHEPNVVIKAKVTIGEHIYTGISAANPAKAIEKQSPYEVAETSAVGRALGFAGYGIDDSIASADEMVKAGAISSPRGSQSATAMPGFGDTDPLADFPSVDATTNRFKRS